MKFAQACAAAVSLAPLVAATCDYVSGNYYCSETDAVVYQNVGYSGSYMDVTSMDETSCSCSQESVSFEGSMSPLDEELSVHFRGPLELLQFGVYYPSSGSSSLKKREDCDVAKRHHDHKREAAVAVVHVTSTMYVDGSGNQVASSNPSATAVYSTSSSLAPATTSQAQSAQTSAAAPASSSPASSSVAPSSGSSSSSSAPASSSSSSSGSTSGSGWNRVSYYTPGSASNLTFMNHQGGTAGSGTWSSCFGNSISYCAADGVSGASSPQALDQVTLASNSEYMIFSGVDCSDTSSGSCGTYRNDIPAHHGFGGDTKMFVFEFKMPHDYSSSYNQDMPAVWMLNAKIPRTLQYGNSECSCWGTGCGELDLFEILSSGSENLITHLHDGQGNNGNSQGGGGTQDYFQRPTSNSLKAAVIFNGADKTLHVVSVDGDFGSTLSASTVQEWLNKSGSVANLA
ncbi:LANO_0E09450g1_1 [Lachancea nothofagi CBS 11611]|uniref:glucan endo-1,3-beta-D-glucosidase n=1 Tax=Lachancea nothofagi CBS 11611 TaxID=1266666 RepID=A0A1G4JVZ1_9SACH|nr:LANO_0E09450g1_1 [Lachancea nothofagi CBS 11611]